MSQQHNISRGKKLRARAVKTVAALIICVLAVHIYASTEFGIAAAPPTYTVTSTADSGEGSLRSILASAGSGQSVGFSFAEGTELLITLESALSVPSGVTIDGSGAPGLTIAVKNAGYDHVTGATGTISLLGLTFAGLGTEVKGAGGIYAAKNLYMENCRVLNTYGGGVYAKNDMTLAGCTFMGNICENNSSVRQGLIRAVNLTMTDCTVRGNGGNGKHIVLGTNSLTMTGCDIEGNATNREGGGIYVGDNGGSITNSVISYNTTSENGGGVYFYGPGTVTDSTFTSNGTSKMGGGIFARSTLTVSGSEFSSNGAAEGGGIWTGTTLNTENCTLTGNYASGKGGGVYMEKDGFIDSSTFSQNRAADSGGGLYSASLQTSVMMSNSTFAYNRAERDGGGAYIQSGLVFYSTFTGNLAGTPHRNAASRYFGMGAGLLMNMGAVSFSIFAGNYNCMGMMILTGEDGGEVLFPSANENLYLAGEAVPAGEGVLSKWNHDSGLGNAFSIIVGKDVTTFMDITCIAQNAEGKLWAGRLADNGGPTKTVALYSASPDHVSFQINNGSGTDVPDQRGVMRDLSKNSPGAYYYKSPYRVMIESDPALDQLPVYDMQTTDDLTLSSLRSALNDGLTSGDTDITIDMGIDYVHIEETVEAQAAREAAERYQTGLLIAIAAVVVILVIVTAVLTFGTAVIGYAVMASSATSAVMSAAYGSAAMTVATVSTIIITAGALASSLTALGAGIGIMSKFAPAAQETEYDTSATRIQTENLLSAVDLKINTEPGRFPGDKYQYVRFIVDKAVLNAPLTWNPGHASKVQTLTIKGKKGADGNAATMLVNKNGGRIIETEREQTIILENLILTGSTAVGSGGAIYAPNAHVILRNCYFLDNKTTGGSGGAVCARQVTTENCVFENNSAFDLGGAIYATNGVKLSGSRLINNTAGTRGGAVYSAANLEASAVILRNNSAVSGGGALYAAGDIILNTGEVSGNAGGTGGAVQGRNVTLVSATVAENTGDGGAVAASEKALLTACTVSGNTRYGVNAKEVTLSASLVAGNTANTLNDVRSDKVTCTGSISGIAQNDLPAVMETKYGGGFIQGKLADNGGYGRTIAVNPLGPAGNALSPALARALGVPSHDARGLPRSEGGDSYDIGAFESKVFIADPNAGTTNMEFLRNAVSASRSSGYKGNTIKIKTRLAAKPEDFSLTANITLDHNVTLIADPNQNGGPGINISGYGFATGSGTIVDPDTGKSYDSAADTFRVANIGFENMPLPALSTSFPGGVIEAYNCTFTNIQGGAVRAYDVWLSNCLFKSNSSSNTSYGGAVTLLSGGGQASRIVNSVFHGNSGPGGSAIVRNNSTLLTLAGNTFTGNTGGGALAGVGDLPVGSFRYNIIFANYSSAGGADTPFYGGNPSSSGNVIADCNIITGYYPASGFDAAKNAAAIFSKTTTDTFGNTVGALTDFGGGKSTVLPAKQSYLFRTFSESLHTDLPFTDCMNTPRISADDNQFYFGASEAVEIGNALTEVERMTLTYTAMDGNKVHLTAEYEKFMMGDVLLSQFFYFELPNYVTNVILTPAPNVFDSAVSYSFFDYGTGALLTQARGYAPQLTFALNSAALETSNIYLRATGGGSMSEYAINIRRHAAVEVGLSQHVDATNNEITLYYDFSSTLSDKYVWDRSGTITLEGEYADSFYIYEHGNYDYRPQTMRVHHGDTEGWTIIRLNDDKEWPDGSGMLTVRAKANQGGNEAVIYVYYEDGQFVRQVTKDQLGTIPAPIGGVSLPDGYSENAEFLVTDQYTATLNYRYEHPENGTQFLNGGAFESGIRYTAVLTVTPKAGYTLSRLPENFFIVTGASEVTSQGNTVYAVFPDAPGITLPEGLTAICGQTLSDISLESFDGGAVSGRFAWITPAASVGAAGTQTHVISFVPDKNADLYGDITFAISVTVTKTAGGTAAAPTPFIWEANGITLNDITLENGQAVEYSCSKTSTPPDSGWQDSPVFTGLDEHTEYYFFARAKADDLFDTGAASEGTLIRTNDGTAPTGSITAGTSVWTSLSDSPAFELCFKDTVTVTISGADKGGSGVNAIEYYLSEDILPENTNWYGIYWTTGTSVTLTAGWKGFIYAWISDNQSNIAIISSCGIAVYSESTTVTSKVSFLKTSSADVTAEVTLNGNTVARIANGADTLTAGTDYTLSGGVITLKAAYLNGLTAGDHTVTVYYNPLGLPFSGNDAPSSTVALTVSKAAGGAAAAPTAATLSANGVTLNAVTIKNGQTAEYSCGTASTPPASGWQDSPVFNGLDEYTEYYFFARAKADENYNTGAASSATLIRTKDGTAPTGSITAGTGVWTSLADSLTFELFFKDTVTVTVSGADKGGSGVKTTEYYLSATVLTESSDWDGIDWTTGTSTALTAGWMGVIYARITDNEGNVTVISSGGIAVYSDSTAITAKVFFLKNSATDITAEVTLSGNTVARITNGTDTLTAGTDYIVSGTGSAITLKASYLNGLDAGDHNITVYFNPLGLPFSGDDAPSISFDLTVTTTGKIKAGCRSTISGHTALIALVSAALLILLRRSRFGITKNSSQ